MRRATSRRVSGLDRLQRRLHWAHKILVTGGNADFDVKNDISRHQHSCGPDDIMARGQVTMTAELTKPMP